MENFFYVYILVSEAGATQHYTGITQDLASRRLVYANTIKAHAYTAKYRPRVKETRLRARLAVDPQLAARCVRTC